MAGAFFRRTAVCCGFLLCLAAVCTAASAGSTQSDAILIDGAAAAGEAAVSQGRHTITAQTASDTDTVWIAVYENGRFRSVSVNGPLDYDFPESGAEIVLFLLDSQLQPIREAVRVRQRAAQKLIYSGEAACYDEWNDYEDREFDDYTLRLNVVTTDGRITDIRDIGGYTSSGKATDGTNAWYLGRAASELPARIIQRQSVEGVDAVSGATCASHALLRAVSAALENEPEPYDDGGGGQAQAVPDGVYAGSAHCLTGFINYMIDVEVTVENGVVAAVTDRTLKTPLSSNDRTLYAAAWTDVSGRITGAQAEGFSSVDAVSGATVSSAGINAAVKNALETQTVPQRETGDVYAPEGISLYARAYPIVTVEGGRIREIRIVPAKDTDTELLEQFAAEIVRRQSVRGLDWPDEIRDDAFSIANLTDQILYGTGALS